MIVALALAIAVASPAPTPPPNLKALVVQELRVPGRYHLKPSAETVPEPSKPWWDRLLTWLQDRVADIWRAAFGRARLGRGGAVAIGDLLMAVAALLVVVAAFRLAGEMRFTRDRRARSVESLDAASSAPELDRAACDRAARGDYVAASRLLFGATVASLDLAGIVRGHRSTTVGELRRELRARDRRLAPPFDDVAAAFVTGTYAEQPVDTAQWERARDAYRLIANQPPS